MRIQQDEQNKNYDSNFSDDFASDSQMRQSTVQQTNVRMQFQEDPKKWRIFFLYLISALVQSIPAQVFTPIADIVVRDFNKTTLDINLCGLLYYLTSVPSNFIVVWVIDHYGLRLGICIGSISLIIGCGVRLLIDYNFYFVIAGQILCSFGNTFFVNSPAKVSGTWFNQKNRGPVTVAFTFAILISGTFGILIPPLLVNEVKEYHRQNIINLLWLEFIIISGVMIFNVFFFSNKPAQPPSFSAIKRVMSYKDSLFLLIKNKDYILLFIGMGCFYGSLLTFYVTQRYFYLPFDFEPIEISQMMVINTVFGIFGSIFIGKKIKKQNQSFKRTILVLQLLGVFSFTGSIFVMLYYNNKYLIYGLGAVQGFAIFPCIPLILELGAEVAYPVAETTATGFLFGAAQILSFFLGLVQTSIIDGTKDGSVKGIIIYGSLFYFSILLIYLSKEKLNRQSAEIMQHSKLLQESLIKEQDDKSKRISNQQTNQNSNEGTQNQKQKQTLPLQVDD